MNGCTRVEKGGSYAASCAISLCAPWLALPVRYLCFPLCAPWLCPADMRLRKEQVCWSWRVGRGEKGEAPEDRLTPVPQLGGVAGRIILTHKRLSRASVQALEECRPDTPCSFEHPTCGRAQVLNINAGKTDIDSFVFEDFELVGYQPHKKIAMELAV